MHHKPNPQVPILQTSILNPNFPSQTANQSEDERWMRRALLWSARGRGLTSPRPSVGCVFVRDDKELGGGHTQHGDGTPHGEVSALNAARAGGYDLRGATAYVTLEPCSHFGTTPPCAEMLVREGVKRVVCGIADPDVRVAGRGLKMLQDAGIAVEMSVLGEECFRAQDAFLISVVRQTPFVSLKLAVSLDGKIALPDGQSQWITGAAARQHAQQLRFEHDAIIVGVETVIQDDPRLTLRLTDKTKPIDKPFVRIVLDSGGRVPPASTCIATARENPTIIATTEQMSHEKRAELEKSGVQVLACCSDENGRVAWEDLLVKLWARHIYSAMIEGGAHVAGSALKAQIVDRVDCFVAPKFLGDGQSALAGFTLQNLVDAPQLERVNTQNLGDDILISGYLPTRKLADN